MSISIFNTGSDLTSFDPLGVGAIILASINRTDMVVDHASVIAPGDLVDGASLQACCISTDTTDETSSGVMSSGSALSGTYMACGHLRLSASHAAGNDRIASLFLKVSV